MPSVQVTPKAPMKVLRSMACIVYTLTLSTFVVIILYQAKQTRLESLLSTTYLGNDYKCSMLTKYTGTRVWKTLPTCKISSTAEGTYDLAFRVAFKEAMFSYDEVSKQLKL